MKELLRAFRFAGHLAVSAASLLWFLCARRGATLVFTHEPDLDPDGRDPQMGLFVDGLRARGRPLIEVTFVSLDRGLWNNLCRKRRPFVSYAVLAACARGLEAFGARGARRTVGRVFLRLLAPRSVFAIDESGSGQLLVQGARRLGIRTVGIQHGDFQPGNPQYSRAALAASSVEPADALCLWSAWFRARLLAISPVYEARKTLVTGRMRLPRRPRPEPVAKRTRRRVLLLAEALPGFRARVSPFLEALAGAPDLEVVVRPHPAEPRGSWADLSLTRASLEEALEEADVVLGVGSSALLEAVWVGRPVVLLQASPGDDPAGYVAERVGIPCRVPGELPALCLRSATSTPSQELRDRIWGDPPSREVVEAILDAERDSSTPDG